MLSYKIKEIFPSRVIFGITLMIAIEAFVNISVSIGLFPTKGLPLPFISYGGTSLFMHMVGLGLILNMSRSIEDIGVN